MLKPFSRPLRRGFKDVIFIRLYRLWANARDQSETPATALLAEVDLQGFAGFTAPACACFFELQEAKLKRPLVPSDMANPRYSADERLLLTTLRSASPSHGTHHRDGLKGALSWAACAVRSGMDFESEATAGYRHASKGSGTNAGY